MKKNLLTVLFAISAMFLTVGCGVQEDEDGDVQDTPCCTDTDETPDADTDTDEGLPAPFRSPAPCVFDFSNAYVSGAVCGEVRGTLPGMSWSSGVQISNPDGDGYMGMAFVVPAGTYEMSYLGWQNCSTREPNDAWAQYGFEEQLTEMTAEARAYINCNWWNAGTGSVISGVNPSCNIRVTVDSECHVLPAGNMADFVGESE